MRIVDVIVAVANAPAYSQRLGRVELTELALLNVMQQSPYVPVSLDHDPSKVVGSVTGWSMSRVGGSPALLARVRLDTEVEGLAAGMGASVEATLDNTRLSDSGVVRVTSLSIDGLALLTGGRSGAWKDARVYKLRPPTAATRTSGLKPPSFLEIPAAPASQMSAELRQVLEREYEHTSKTKPCPKCGNTGWHLHLADGWVD